MPTLLDNDSFIHKNERQEHQKDSLWKSSFNSDWRGSYCDEWLRVDDENMNILLPLNVDNVQRLRGRQGRVNGTRLFHTDASAS